MDIPKDQKFMALRRAWIVEQVADGLVKGFHCHTSNMLADANNKDHTVEQQHTELTRNALLDLPPRRTQPIYLPSAACSSSISYTYAYAYPAFHSSVCRGLRGAPC